jgi:hypothetical protein
MERLLSCLTILLLLWGLCCFDLLGVAGEGLWCHVLEDNPSEYCLDLLSWRPPSRMNADRNKAWRIILEDRFIFFSHLQHAVFFLSAISVCVNKHYSVCIIQVSLVNTNQNNGMRTHIADVL